MLVKCLVWIYATPLGDEVDEDGCGLPQDIAISVAVNPDQIPDEAALLRG